MRVNFDDKERYKYVLDLLAIQKANPFNIQAYEQFLDGENQDLMVLLDRFNRNAPTVLPFFREKHNDIVWLVVSEDRQEFIQCAEEVRSFITPVWAEIYPFNDTSSFPYHSDAFFPYGLKMFKSPMRLSNSTIKLLYRWTKLRDMKPVFSPEEGKTNIYLLRSQFQEAVALNRWDEANSFLGIIRQGHYLSDENCVFLEFQLLSAQQHWEILWNHKNYVLATGLDPLPAKVRQVLLTAFCQVILLPVANDSDKMISEYRINCYRLGTLLSYKAGLQDDSQLLVFVLDAVCEGDKNRFDNLVNKLRDEYYISVAERLRTKLPANLPENTPNLYHLCEEGTSLEKAKLALSERLYDDAFIYTLDCARGIIRIQLLPIHRFQFMDLEKNPLYIHRCLILIRILEDKDNYNLFQFEQYISSIANYVEAQHAAIKKSVVEKHLACYSDWSIELNESIKCGPYISMLQSIVGKAISLVSICSRIDFLIAIQPYVKDDFVENAKRVSNALSSIPSSSVPGEARSSIVKTIKYCTRYISLVQSLNTAEAKNEGIPEWQRASEKLSNISLLTDLKLLCRQLHLTYRIRLLVISTILPDETIFTPTLSLELNIINSLDSALDLVNKLDEAIQALPTMDYIMSTVSPQTTQEVKDFLVSLLLGSSFNSPIELLSHETLSAIQQLYPRLYAALQVSITAGKPMPW